MSRVFVLLSVCARVFGDVAIFLFLKWFLFSVVGVAFDFVFGLRLVLVLILVSFSVFAFGLLRELRLVLFQIIMGLEIRWNFILILYLGLLLCLVLIVVPAFNCVQRLLSALFFCAG